MTDKSALFRVASIPALLTIVAVLSGCAEMHAQRGGVGPAKALIEEEGQLHIGLTRSSDVTKAEQRISDINSVLASETDLFNAVSVLSNNEAKSGERLGDLIKRLEEELERADRYREEKPAEAKKESIARGMNLVAQTENVEVVEAFVGLGGAFSEILLRAAKEKVGDDGSFNDKKVTVSITGVLTDYKLFSDWSGHLENRTTAIITVDGRRLDPMVFYWIVDVLPGVFEIHERNDDVRSDPFPGTLVLSPEMVERVYEKGFDRKLWAEGEGIKIRKLLFDRGDGNGLQPVPEGHPLLKSDSKSCIDMMFVKLSKPKLTRDTLPPRRATPLPGRSVPPPGDEIPTTLAELMDENSYCLGRCMGPAMVNSK